MNEIQQDREKQHQAKLEAEREQWVKLVTAALKAKGLDTTRPNARCLVATLPGTDFDTTFSFDQFAPRHSYTGLKTYNRVTAGGYGNKSIWRSIDAGKAEVIAKHAVEVIRLSRVSKESREAHAVMTKEFDAKKQKELAGVFPLPGIRMEIIMGNSTDAGKYLLIIDRDNSALRGPWTLEQMKAIVAALEGVVTAHPYRVGRRASTETPSRIMGDGVKVGTIVEADVNRVILRVLNPDTTGATVWTHDDIYVPVSEPTLKLVDEGNA